MEDICGGDNLESSFKCISNHLEIFGLPVHMFEPDKGKDALIFSINALWALIKLRKKDISIINHDREEIMMLKADIKRLNQLTISRDKEITKTTEELKILKNKVNLIEEEKLTLISQINLLKKECNQLIITSETDRKLYQKNIQDQKLYQNLDRDNVIEKESVISQKILNSSDENDRKMNECVQSLDCTIQHLLGEIASIRCVIIKLLTDLSDLPLDDEIKSLLPKCTGSDEPGSIFQLPHEQFLQTINSNIQLITLSIRKKMLGILQEMHNI